MTFGRYKLLEATKVALCKFYRNERGLISRFLSRTCTEVSGVENVGQCGFWAHFNIVTYLLTYITRKRAPRVSIRLIREDTSQQKSYPNIFLHNICNNNGSIVQTVGETCVQCVHHSEAGAVDITGVRTSSYQRRRSCQTL